MSDSEGAEGTGLNSDCEEKVPHPWPYAEQDYLPARGLQEQPRHRQACTGSTVYEGSMEEQTGNLQQRDTSEEDIEDSDMDEATEAEETHPDARRYSSSSSAHEPGRKKMYASEEHNRKERLRRKELKNAVDELRKQLSKPTKKASTISVLKAAQEEIQDLTTTKNQDEGRLEELKQRHGQLKFKLERLKMEFQEKPGATTMVPTFPMSSPLSQLTLPPPALRPQIYPPLVGDGAGARPLPMPPQPMIIVGPGGLHPMHFMVPRPPPPPMPPSLVRLQPSHSIANTYANHAPCPTLLTPCLPPLQPISFRPGLVGHAQIPHLSALGGVGPSAGIFASMNSWTDNPANQRPYFPVTVFSQPPTCKLSTTNTAVMPPCPPLSSQHTHCVAPPLLQPRSPSPPLREATSVESISVQENAHHRHSLLSSSTAPNPHIFNNNESPPAAEQRSSTPPPSQAARRSSRIGNSRDSYAISDSYSYSEHKAFPSTPEDMKRPHKGPVGRTRRKASPSNEDDTADETLDYSREKRAKRGDLYSSGSDSDSGGSCFSEQGPMRNRTGRNKKRREDSRSNGSKGENRKSGGSSGGKSVPMLFPVGKGCLESIGMPSSKREAATNVQTSDGEECTIKRHGPPTEGSPHVVGESSMGRNFVVSLTSNYDISTGVEGTGYREDGGCRPSTIPPPLDSRPTNGDRPPNEPGWEKSEKSKNWMDEIVERTVHTYTNKFLKLSSATAF